MDEQEKEMLDFYAKLPKNKQAEFYTWLKDFVDKTSRETENNTKGQNK